MDETSFIAKLEPIKIAIKSKIEYQCIEIIPKSIIGSIFILLKGNFLKHSRI